MLNKRGERTTEELPEIILGAVAFFILVFLLYNLIAPNFDKGDETAESYFDNFKEQVVVADSGGVGSFSIWLPENKNEKRKFFLVYFGDSSSYGDRNKLAFYSLGNNVNNICLCYSEDGDTLCDYCENLKYPAIIKGQDKDASEGWAIGVGEKIEIRMEGGVYEVKRL